MRRFYAPRTAFENGLLLLGAEQTRHIKNVLRLAEGDSILVFDGIGGEFSCEILEIGKQGSKLKVIKNERPLSPESSLEMTLAVSLLKGDKFELVIQKAVELGVAKLAPMFTHRTDVKSKNIAKKFARWRKIVIEASKQCGRATLMEISEPSDLDSVIETSKGSKVMFSERGGGGFAGINCDEKITAVIGPEGGWDDSEIDLAKQNGFQIVTLGGRILRAETAAISIVSLLQHRFGDLN